MVGEAGAVQSRAELTAGVVASTEAVARAVEAGGDPEPAAGVVPSVAAAPPVAGVEVPHAANVSASPRASPTTTGRDIGMMVFELRWGRWGRRITGSSLRHLRSF